jgi:hypothetical protein
MTMRRFRKPIRKKMWMKIQSSHLRRLARVLAPLGPPREVPEQGRRARRGSRTRRS